KSFAACRHSLVRLMILFASLLIIGLPALAQETSQYDRGTPPQHKAGVSPFGSYISADLGIVNLSNGALTIKLPLGQVGGRGFGIPLSLNYSSKVWSATLNSEFVPEPLPNGHREKVAYAVYDDPGSALDLYNRVAPGWSIGGAPILRARG